MHFSPRWVAARCVSGPQQRKLIQCSHIMEIELSCSAEATRPGCDVNSQISNPVSLLQFYSTGKTTCICWPWDGLPPKEKDRPCCFQLHLCGCGCDTCSSHRLHGFCCPLTLSQKGLPRSSTDAYLLSIILNKLLLVFCFNTSNNRKLIP